MTDISLDRRSFLAGTAALLATPNLARAQAAAWPTKPVRIVVTFRAGRRQRSGRAVAGAIHVGEDRPAGDRR